MTKFWIEHKKNIILFLIAVGVVACLILANFLSKFIIPSNSTADSVSVNATEMYLISLSKSKVKKESQERAKDFQSIGAGGFIWQQDEYYHVITSAYLNKSDAALVQNSIKLNQNLESELLPIKFNSFKIFGNFESEEAKVLNKLLSSPLEFYSSLYDIAISLDTGVYNETTAKLAVNSAQTSLASNIANFNTLFPSPLPENISPLKQMIDDVFILGQRLSACEKVDENQTYSSLIKYYYLSILKTYYEFVK